MFSLLVKMVLNCAKTSEMLYQLPFDKSELNYQQVWMILPLV